MRSRPKLAGDFRQLFDLVYLILYDFPLQSQPFRVYALSLRR
jgi:hypothetical protein